VHPGGVTSSDDATPARGGGWPYYGEPSDCPNGGTHQVRVWAAYTAADGLTVHVVDAADWPCPDIEYTYHVAPQHIARLRAALGAAGDEDVVSLLGQRYEQKRMPTLGLDSWLAQHGVTYSAAEERHPN